MPQNIDITTIISILGLGAAGVSIYTGLRNSEDLKHIKDLNQKIVSSQEHRIKISNKFYVHEDLMVVSDNGGSIPYKVTASNRRYLKRAGDQLSKYIEGPIESSALMNTPKYIQNILANKPDEILSNIQPLSTRQPAKEKRLGLIPVIFNYDSEYFIGWQEPSVLKRDLGLTIENALWREKLIRSLQVESTEGSVNYMPSKGFIKCPRCSTEKDVNIEELFAGNSAVLCGNCNTMYDAFENSYTRN